MQRHHRARRSAAVLCVFLVLGGAVGATIPQAHAKVHPNLVTIFRTAGLGVLGGTLIGLISFPFSQDARTIFMGSSVGLYVGAAAGVYFNGHRDDAKVLLDHVPVSGGPYRWEGDLAQLQFQVSF
jgi:hypothetical protein